MYLLFSTKDDFLGHILSWRRQFYTATQLVQHNEQITRIFRVRYPNMRYITLRRKKRYVNNKSTIILIQVCKQITIVSNSGIQ